MADGEKANAKTTRNRLIIIGIIIAVVASVVVIIAATSGDSEPAGSFSESTTEVTQQDLVDRETVSGTLQFSDAQDLVAQSSGTVTSLRSDGSKVVRGKALWRINQQPAVLMFGSVPAYRSMSVGNRGADVNQLKKNLKKLGYKGLSNDNSFTSATSDAVSQWQDDVGLPQSGSVFLGQVIFTPASVRVAGQLTQVGSVVQPGAPMLSVTSQVREVAVDLSTSDQSLATLKEEVDVTLPDGTNILGRITSIGTVATSNAAPGQQGANTTSTIPVTVTLDRPGQARQWDSAPVDVGLQANRVSNVLTVPISALLALAEGGYAIEVITDTDRQLIAVDTGLFADGQVEISGAGIEPGTTVVVPTR